MFREKIKIMKNSLIWQFFLIVIIFLVVILLDIIITDGTIKRIMQKNIETSNDKIMQQIDAKTNEFYNSIFNIMTLVSYEQTTYKYFTQSNVDRINNYNDLISSLSNTMMVQEDIAGIAVYDMEMNNIINTGKKFSHFQKVSLVQEIVFSEVFRANSSSESYYIVSYPVYDIKNQNYDKQIGMLVFLMRTNKFSSYLTDAQLTDNSCIYLLDTQNTIIACEGKNKADILQEDRLVSDKTTYVKVIQQKDTGWKIVSMIPVREMMSSMVIVKSAIFITYFIIFFSLLLFIYFCFQLILKPLHKVDLFVRRSAEYPLERVEIKGSNEISLLAENLNHMLDERDFMSECLRNSQRVIYETELARKQLQVLAYRNQINPHFLYNTFDCIRAMALYYDAEEIAEITMALSRVFRYAIKGENIVVVQDEVNYINEYAKIINYRFAGKIKVILEVEEEVRMKNVIKLILQPLVENSVFHGLEEKMEDGVVKVIIKSLPNQKIKFLVKDNGCGMSREKVDEIVYKMKRNSLRKSSEHDSIGLLNIYQRLLLFYGEDMEFDITSVPNEGTTVRIVIAECVKEGGDAGDV